MLSAVFACSSGSSPNPSVSRPPGQARIEAPVVGLTAGLPGDFRCIAEDPDGDALTYAFDWGRAAAEVSLSERVPSGTAGDVAPVFQTKGQFSARCRAVDTHGQLGAWSELVAFTVEPAPPQDDGKRTLAVEVFGAGRVTSTPEGLSGCTGPCMARFDVGTQVTLQAEPAEGWRFTGWMRCGPEQTPQVIRVEQNRRCGVGFAPTLEHSALWRQSGARHPIAVAWSPDGVLLAVLDRVGGEGSLRIWNAQLGHVSRVIRVEGSDIRAVAWGPRMEDLIAGFEDGQLARIDPNTGAPVQRWRAHSGRVLGVAWNPDGNEFASISNLDTGGGEVRFWSADTGTERREPLLTEYPVHQIHWSPDARRIALEVQGEMVEIHPLAPAGPLYRQSNAHGFAWSPDGARYAVGSFRYVRVYEAATHEQQAMWTGPWGLLARMDWSRTKDWLVVVDGLRSLTVLEANTGTVVADGFEPLPNPLSASGYGAVRFHPVDNTFVATEREPAAVSVFQVDEEHARVRRTELLAHLRAVNATAWSPAGARLASAGSEGKVRLWSDSGQALGALDGHGGRDVRALGWSEEGTRLATGGDDGRLCVWDVNAGTRVRTPVELTPWSHGQQSRVEHAALTPDGRTLAGAGTTVSPTGRKGTVQVWDVGSGTELLRIPETPSPVVELKWTPDGASLIIVYSQGAWNLWHRTSGVLRRMEPGLTGIVAAALNPDRTHLALSTSEQLAVLDLSTGAFVASARTWLIQLALAWSPDGTRLASGGEGGLLFSWDVREAGAFQPTVMGAHESTILGISWRGDGKAITTGGWDAELFSWLAPEKPSDR
ncbi:WD40 repeat [Myxococcus virescens]|uniref:WD40 repeat n=1 Tax=Myxococcus virescens TaxID=83456 RepID=A0ABY0N4K7_9BACT|nr:WD40 repeat [Myxococcus virescens]